MKKLLLMLMLSVAFTGISQAQKFAYVNSQYILRHMPEYAEAQGQLNQFSNDWEAEIQAKFEAVQRLRDAYQAEKVLLTEDMKQRRLEEIKQKEKEARDMQRQKFGVDGELFQKREQLIKPIQDKIYEALEEVASRSGYMVIFDKASQSNMLYTNPKYDITDTVIKNMGLTPGETIESDEDKDEKGDDSKGGARDKGGKSGGKDPSGNKTSTGRTPMKGGRR
jgi:outer membrane protein